VSVENAAGISTVLRKARAQGIKVTTWDADAEANARDYFINQRFRRDVFVKGAVPLSVAAATARWLDMRFVLDGPRGDIGMTVRGAQSEVTLQEEVYDPVLDALAAGPRTVREMLADPKVDALGWPRLQQALAILVGAGHAHPARGAEGDAARRAGATAFNRVMLENARGSDAMQFMGGTDLTVRRNVLSDNNQGSALRIAARRAPSR